MIGSDIADHQPVILGDFLSAQFGVFGSGAHEMLHRSRPADRFLDNPGQQIAVGLEPRELLGILSQRHHRPCRRGRGRVVTGSRENDIIARHVAVAEMLAVDFCVRDHACDVIGRIGAFFCGQLGKIGFEVGDSADHQLHDLLRRHIGHAGLVEIFILSAEHLLGEEQHALLVRFRHAQYLHHHVQRIGRGNQWHKIGFTACVDQPVDRDLG